MRSAGTSQANAAAFTRSHVNALTGLSRSTHLDPEPKVGIRHIDLFKLYNRVVEEGGYDLVSDTKAKPLMWRKLAEEFVGRNQYTAAQAFQIKNVYYKNLCAYEISTHWKQEPPPKEILEEVTAKGGNVMGRTKENFVKPLTKEERNLAGADDEDGTSPEQKTPKPENATDGAEDPGSATGRTTRGLRQAPPQRVLFQPDLTSGRQTRGQVQASNSPAPTSGGNGIMNASSLTNGASSTLANYEPSQSYPLSLKPVTTPANNPDFYRNERKRKAEANAGPLAKKYRNIMLPGTGFIGPNIYVRAQLALQSAIPEEEQYALHHLVKISHERGDKYRFDQFPGLAEALVKKVLQVSSLFYDVEWDVSYDDDTMDADDETLNGLTGTSDVVRKLKSRIPKITEDGILDGPAQSLLNRITEAGLVIRNMCLQHENAQYMIKHPLVRDCIAIVLNLPQHPAIIELQHYALEIAEQLLVWCDLSAQDALYQSLLAQLYGQDRGAIITALKTLSRIAMNLAGAKRLDDVPRDVLRNVQNWLLVEDEELRSACLDFLFQYTSFADNVDHLLHSIDAEVLAQQLSRLLLFGATEQKTQRSAPRQPEEDRTATIVPRLSKSIVENLLKLEEPERSSEWLRMCFIADKDSEMTQISLWQAYQATFAPYSGSHPHLIAGDFIKNVSTTFAGATAQVAGANKYVIKGIRARKVPVDTGMLAGSKGFADKGKELSKCCWRMMIPTDPIRDPITGVQSGPITKEVECLEWFKSGDAMLQHILRDHLQVPQKKADDASDKMVVDSRPASAIANGHNGTHNNAATKTTGEMFDFAAADKTTYRCRWGGSCRRISPEFATNGKVPRTALFARHIQTHLPDTNADHSKHNLKPSSERTPINIVRLQYDLLVDEKNDLAGIPLGAVLVLRNIAKFMPQPPPVEVKSPLMAARKGRLSNGQSKEQAAKDEGGLIARVFDDEVRERLFFALAHGKALLPYVGQVLKAIGQHE
jgi:chromatin structure-remodeling complex subunit RSC9